MTEVRKPEGAAFALRRDAIQRFRFVRATLDEDLGLGLPGILMTALPPGDARRSGLDCPVLTKPFDDIELAAAMARTDD